MILQIRFIAETICETSREEGNMAENVRTGGILTEEEAQKFIDSLDK